MANSTFTNLFRTDIQSTENFKLWREEFNKLAVSLDTEVLRNYKDQTLSGRLRITNDASNNQLNLIRTGTASGNIWLWTETNFLRIGPDNGSGVAGTAIFSVDSATGNVSASGRVVADNIKSYSVNSPVLGTFERGNTNNAVLLFKNTVAGTYFGIGSKNGELKISSVADVLGTGFNIISSEGNQAIGANTIITRNASTNYFSGATPLTEFLTGSSTTAFEEFISIRHANNSSGASLRRVGLSLSLSDESTITEANKSGFILLESTSPFAADAKMSFVLNDLERLSIANDGSVDIVGDLSVNKLVIGPTSGSVESDIIIRGNANITSDNDMNFIVDGNNNDTNSTFTWRRDSYGLTGAIDMMQLSQTGELTVGGKTPAYLSASQTFTSTNVFNGNVTFNGAIRSTKISGTTNINTLNDGLYGYGYAGVSTLLGALPNNDSTYGNILQIFDGAQSNQLYFGGANSSTIAVRRNDGGSWNAWTEFLKTTDAYVHPSYNADSYSLDTGPLSGATVISDLDFNLTSDSTGHVVDANAVVSTRNLTAANIGAVSTSTSSIIASLNTANLLTIERLDSNNATMRFKNTGAITYIGVGAANGELLMGSNANLLGFGKTILHTGNIDIQGGVASYIKNNYEAVVAPTVSDDLSLGYSVGSVWYDKIDNLLYRLTNASVSAAVWQQSSVDVADLGSYAFASTTDAIVHTGTFSFGNLGGINIGANATVQCTIRYYQDTDITALVNGSQSGTILESQINGHMVIGLRSNDVNDSFSVIATNDFNTSNSYDLNLFSVDRNTATVHGNDILHTGSAAQYKNGIFNWRSGEGRINLNTLSGTNGQTGAYWAGTGVTNYPVAIGGSVLNIHHDAYGDFSTQLYIHQSGNNLSWRGNQVGIWSSWKQAIHTDGGQTINGALTIIGQTNIRNGSGIIGTGTGTANTAFFEFNESDALTRQGYIGLGSPSTNTLYLKNEVTDGDILFDTTGTILNKSVVSINNNIIFDRGHGIISNGSDIYMTSSGLIATQDNMYFNIDSTGSAVGRIFRWGHNTETAASSELMRLTDNGELKLTGYGNFVNSTNTNLFLDQTGGGSLHLSLRVGGNTKWYLGSSFSDTDFSIVSTTTGRRSFRIGDGTDNVTFEGNVLSIGVDATSSSASVINFRDANSATFRSLQWNNINNRFELENNSGVTYKILTEEDRKFTPVVAVNGTSSTTTNYWYKIANITTPTSSAGLSVKIDLLSRNHSSMATIHASFYGNINPNNSSTFVHVISGSDAYSVGPITNGDFKIVQDTLGVWELWGQIGNTYSAPRIYQNSLLVSGGSTITWVNNYTVQLAEPVGASINYYANHGVVVNTNELTLGKGYTANNVKVWDGSAMQPILHGGGSQTINGDLTATTFTGIASKVAVTTSNTSDLAYSIAWISGNDIFKSTDSLRYNPFAKRLSVTNISTTSISSLTDIDFFIDSDNSANDASFSWRKNSDVVGSSTALMTLSEDSTLRIVNPDNVIGAEDASLKLVSNAGNNLFDFVNQAGDNIIRMAAGQSDWSSTYNQFEHIVIKHSKPGGSAGYWEISSMYNDGPGYAAANLLRVDVDINNAPTKISLGGQAVGDNPIMILQSPDGGGVGTADVIICNQTDRLKFFQMGSVYGGSPNQQTVTGSRGNLEQGFANLLTALDAYGLIIDSTTI